MAHPAQPLADASRPEPHGFSRLLRARSRDGNPVWVLDVASGQMVHQASTLSRFLRNR